VFVIKEIIYKTHGCCICTACTCNKTSPCNLDSVQHSQYIGWQPPAFSECQLSSVNEVDHIDLWNRVFLLAFYWNLTKQSHSSIIGSHLIEWIPSYEYISSRTLYMRGIYSPYNENTSDGLRHCGIFCKSSCHNPKLPINLLHPWLYWVVQCIYSILRFEGLRIYSGLFESNLCSINLLKRHLMIRYQTILSCRRYWVEKNSHELPKTFFGTVTRILDTGIQIPGIKACVTKVGLFNIKILYILCILPRNLDKFYHNVAQTDHNLFFLNYTACKEKYV
jgi:hypothetical protein